MGQVFKSRPSKICGRRPLKNFTGSTLEYFVPSKRPVTIVMHEKRRKKCLSTYRKRFLRRNAPIKAGRTIFIDATLLYLFWCLKPEEILSIIISYLQINSDFLRPYSPFRTLFEKMIKGKFANWTTELKAQQFTLQHLLLSKSIEKLFWIPIKYSKYTHTFLTKPNSKNKAFICSILPTLSFSKKHKWRVEIRLNSFMTEAVVI